MEIIKLTDAKICQWNYNWWGIRSNCSFEEVECNLEHSLCTRRLPQTFVALVNGEPAGMYQFAMADDLSARPDLYSWLINVYVDEAFRGKNVCRELMNSVRENAKAAGLTELFLYTKHVGLYKKFGWEFVEEVPTFREDSPLERLYHLNIDKPKTS